MYSITVKDEFSAAHNLRNYKGKCEKLHGHNYRVCLTVEGVTLDKSGMLVDFTVLKSILESVLSKFDHGYLNDIPPFDKINPTAENIAKYIFKQTELKINLHLKLKVKEVVVWETEKNCATYYEK
ncbi:MAG: 6-carboxytetrahydropterin synthase QueD [Elusimicrobia bacterium HGW-Elusimicrobia-4]|nr:MAG: 6-carboxytetrahydropterin synthase QueD [Elusimicrobia bacterium HGW-Elusimicrobia-4]